MKDEVIQILRDGAKTLEERHAVYGDNYKKVGAVMFALLPDGIELKTAEDHERFHVLECVVRKLCRFANSGMANEDSIRDLWIYSAIMEFLKKPEEKK